MIYPVFQRVEKVDYQNFVYILVIPEEKSSGGTFKFEYSYVYVEPELAKKD